ncbi:MAG: hypothetical protein JWO19_2248 [Bryobacterales bacterium]|nr:hypothetical protein [Bryobacterales bacterium]
MKNFLCGILFCLMVLCARDAHAVTMTSGSTVTGSVPSIPPCISNCYDTQTFTGTTGHGIYITVVDSFGAPTITIWKPDGTQLTTGLVCGGAFCRHSSLPVSGTYSVRISGNTSGAPGGYTLYYVAGAEAVSNGALTSGATAHDTLPSGGLTSYTFSGTASQGMQLHLTTPSAAWSAYIFVYTPNGTYYTVGTNGINLTSLPTTGTYTIVVQSTGTGYGSYDLSYVIGGGGVSDGALTSGGLGNAGTLPAGQMTSYTFSGTTGRSLALAVGGMNFGTYMYIYTPDGHYWTYTSANDYTSLATTLPQTGTYTVVLIAQSSTSTGSYKMYFMQTLDTVSQNPQPFHSGAFDPSSMGSAQIRSYSFKGVTGQAMAMHVGATYPVMIIAYTPDGHYLGYNNSTAIYNINSLTQTGTYTFLVYPLNYTYTDPGSYNFYFVKGNAPVSEGWLINGKLRHGTMQLNAIKSYKFLSKASSPVSITTSCTFGTYGCDALLYKPDGTYWTITGNTYSGTSPAITGNYTYTLVLYEQTGLATGNYTVTVSAIPPDTTPGPCLTCMNAAANPGASPANSVANDMRSAFLIGGPFAAAAAGIADAFSSTWDRLAPSVMDIFGASTFAGNPINFDAGFKSQTATDYSAGGLSFTRIYRSDSTWTNNAVGTLWRHNYARTFTITGGTAASLTDNTGVTTTYTLSGSNWVADDPATTAALATVTGGYTYTLQNGTVEKYNSSKLLTRIEYLGGGALNLTYNGSNQLTGIANENNRSLSLTYDGSGRVATLVTPDGTFTYAYDANSNLSTVTKPDTKVITYKYENATYIHALTGIVDENGNRYSTYAYDATTGKANSTQLAGGVNQYSITYATNTSGITNPLSKSFTEYFVNVDTTIATPPRRVVQIDGAASTNTVASSQYYNYDDFGHVTGMTDWQDVMTDYVYDDRSNVTRIIDAEDTTQQRVTNIAYNATWNLPSLITQPGKTTAYAYDTYGRLTSVTVTDTATSETRNTTYTYYSNSTDPSGNTILGRLHTIDGPRTDVSDVTTFAYDTNFDLTTITNALSQVTTITARDSAGRPKKITDANSVETDLAYDTNGRLTSAIQAYGTALAATTSFAYDYAGNLTQVTLPNSVTVQYTYDNAHRLTGIQDALGNTVTYALNNAGNVTQTVYKNTTPTTTYTHTASFDELARLLTSVGASSQTANFAWDTNSNLTTYTDPRTHATGLTYDALQRLATATDALSGVATPGYDALDDVTSMKDHRNNSTTYTYNAFGDVTGETSPDRGTSSYTLNKAGNVTQRTDARSVITTFTYDAINRLSTVAYPSDTSLNASLTYDASSGCGTPYKGHLCSVTDAAGTTAYQYDVLGRVTQQKDTRGSLTFTTSFSYDLADNITGITLPSGRTVTYTLNGNGQVSGVSATVNGSSTTLASSITYLPFGPMKGLTYGNSLTFTGTYDQDYNPTNRTVSGSIYNWTYTADNNGNITQAGSTTYGYDNIDRVNAENPGTSTSYTYDASSNRLTKVQGSTTTTTVPSTSNKISAVGGNSYSYDSSGNITGDGVNTYTWNAEGELKTVVVGGSTVGTYTYNVYRQRAKKVAASTTYYVYGTGGRLYGEYDTSGNFIREYVYLNSASLAQINSGSPEVLTYLHTDHLGTPRFGTNNSGTQVWSWNNDAFGTSAPSGTATVNLRMPGQYYDSESGLFYNWNRVYNPAIGRYISSDPVGLAGGLNTFGYVGANPLMWLDPFGLDGKGAAWWAWNQISSSDWSPWTTSSYGGKTNGFGVDKCNWFVHEALKQGGNAPVLPPGRKYPYTAGEWYDKGLTIPGYLVLIPMGPPAPGEVVGTPRDGDVVAVDHHVGIYVLDGTLPSVVSAATTTNTVLWNDWAFRKTDPDYQEPTFRRCACDAQ